MVVCESVFGFLSNIERHSKYVINSSNVIFEYIENNEKHISIRKINISNNNSLFFNFKLNTIFLNEQVSSLKLDGITINILFISYNRTYTNDEAFLFSINNNGLSDFKFRTNESENVQPMYKISLEDKDWYMFKENSGNDSSVFIVDDKFKCPINDNYDVWFSVNNKFSFRTCVDVEGNNRYGMFLGYTGRNKILVCYYNEKSKSFELKEVFLNTNDKTSNINKTINFYEWIYSIIKSNADMKYCVSDFNEDEELEDVPSGSIVLFNRLSGDNILNSWYIVSKMIVRNKKNNFFNVLRFFYINTFCKDKNSNISSAKNSSNFAVLCADTMHVCDKAEDIVVFLNDIKINGFDYKYIIDNIIIDDVSRSNFMNQIKPFVSDDCDDNNNNDKSNISECNYKIFDFVILKNKQNGSIAVYQFESQDELYYHMIGGIICGKEYFEIMPYKGNEHLIK